MTKKPRPATYGCENCGATYRMGAETVIRLYFKQPWFNHLATACPSCRTSWYVWELQEASVGYLAANNQSEGDAVRFEAEQFADEGIWRAYCKDTGKLYPEERAISLKEQAHIDATVAFEAWLLERDESWET